VEFEVQRVATRALEGRTDSVARDRDAESRALKDRQGGDRRLCRKADLSGTCGNERLMIGEAPLRTRSAEAIADELAPETWACHAAGEGAKGPRLYDWARVRLFRLQQPPWDHWLLIRRSRRRPEERAYYVVFAPAETSLAELAGVAGLRWTIEDCFQRAKGELGLDHCEARSWAGWHRHMTLCMAGLAFLTRLDATLRRTALGKPNETSPGAPAAA
jgi:hypothetical protein